MHLQEFKAWFEGYTEEMDGPPNAKQWKKVKKRVDEITPDWTPRTVFIDRYVPRPYLTWFQTTGAPNPSGVWAQNSVSSKDAGISSVAAESIAVSDSVCTEADWAQLGRLEAKG